MPSRLFSFMVRVAGLRTILPCLSGLAAQYLYRLFDGQVIQVVTQFQAEGMEEFTRDDFMNAFNHMFPEYNVLENVNARSRALQSYHKTYGYLNFKSANGSRRKRTPRDQRRASSTCSSAASTDSARSAPSFTAGLG